ncbi:SRPBCC family protein [Nannocystis radixulma]|uniref:SRPBCC family protein n=1 Tax=Nannocystis radixulma TaxID=2995305 RepID=A0ABT5B0P9_9BACT|nr:SRPBCC family protein [Nannocystis radixulma]MDC0666651.1 SRPBCC family protein [Nannocystis radixulma]
MTETPPVLEHRASFPLPAAPERAFRALVEPAALSRWFAEHVRVEPRVGGAFEFHGRAAFASPSVREATQQLVAFEPGTSLTFQWTIHGVDTEVRWTVTPGETAETSRLEVVHTVRGALPFKRPRHVLDDLWRMTAGNLMDHLAARADVVLPDFISDRPEVRVSIDIDAPPARVFRALLDPALMNRWLHGTAHVDLERRQYSYGWNYDVEGRSVAGGPTTILELVENERLVTDWPDWRGEPDQPTTRVTWLLEPLRDGAATRVTIVHDGFGSMVDRSDYQQGWAGFAEQLRQIFA